MSWWLFIGWSYYFFTWLPMEITAVIYRIILLNNKINSNTQKTDLKNKCPNCNLTMQKAGAIFFNQKFWNLITKRKAVSSKMLTLKKSVMSYQVYLKIVITTAVDDIERKEPTKTPSDNFAPHNCNRQTTVIINNTSPISTIMR